MKNEDAIDKNSKDDKPIKTHLKPVTRQPKPEEAKRPKVQKLKTTKLDNEENT